MTNNPEITRKMLARSLEHNVWSALFMAQMLGYRAIDTNGLQIELTALFAAVSNLRRRVEDGVQ